jgi:hypothetical protein
MEKTGATVTKYSSNKKRRGAKKDGAALPPSKKYKNKYEVPPIKGNLCFGFNSAHIAPSVRFDQEN